MQTDILLCPACRGRVRIPRQYLGTQVQCPLCHAKFRAPDPLPVAEVRPDDQFGYEVTAAPPEQAENSALATWLTLTGIGVILANLLSLLVSALNILVSFDRELANQISKNSPFGMRLSGDDLQVALFLKGGIFLVVSTLGLFGGVMMLLRRAYLMALIGSVATILNLSDCCCLPLNFLLGLGGLVVLLLPGTRDLFRR
jgi:hypothetical protein